MSGYFLFIHVNEWAPFSSADAIPISTGYILSSLRKQGFDGEILGDYKNLPLSPGYFKEKLTTLQPHVIGFSTYAENIERVRFWARLAKFIQPEIITVLGGPQITFMPGEALLQMDEIDLLCRGDGEIVLPGLAQTLVQGLPVNQVPGLCLLADGLPVETGETQLPQNLDELPSPYLDGTLDVTGKESIILFTSRGCNANCSFCYTPRASKFTLQVHSTERVINEMQYLKNKGIHDFWFADPNFASSRSRVEEICLAIKENVPGIRFWCQARHHQLDRQLIQLLTEAGAATIAFGLESSDTNTLRMMNKQIQPERLARVVSLCREAGIKVELFTLYGLPGDTFKSALATLNFVRENGVEIEGNSISQQLHLFFGAPVADNPERWGIHCMPVTRPAYHSVCRDFITSEMTQEEICKMSLLWRLHRKDFKKQVDSGQDLFRVAGFINTHYEKLSDTPLRDILLSRIYLQLDEQEAAAKSLSRLRHNWPNHMEARQETAGRIVAYQGRRRLYIKKGCKIIYDCKGLAGGKVIPETVQFYQIAVVGSGKLLPQFEKNLIGVKSGSAVQFDITFPVNYGQKKLAGRTLPFQVFLHKVLDPVYYNNAEEMHNNPVRNMYRFDDLIGLKKYNEPLYYMVLRDSVLHSYTGNITDIIALFDFYLKLGFRDKALDLASSLHKEPSVLAHIGRILQVNGHGEDALEFLELAKGNSAEALNQLIRAHLQLGQFNQAENAANNQLLATNLETLNLKVKLAAQAKLPLDEYLQRMNCLLDVQVKMAASSS